MASTAIVPTIIPDVPICAVFLAIYIPFAATNMTVFQKNRKRNYKFIPSVMIFGFCMARITTLVLRIAWSTRHENQGLAIAANILVSAGILIIYIINLLFAQRILRAEKPRLGWNRVLHFAYIALYFCLAGALVMVITATIISFNTKSRSTLLKIRSIQRAAITFLFVFTTLPLWILAIVQFTPKSSNRESFGQGSMTKKKVIVLVSTCLCVLSAGFNTGSAWMPPRPPGHPAWYQKRPAFYCFRFVVEVCILCVLTFTRVDRLFFVPNGSKKEGDYTRLRSVEEEVEEEHKPAIKE